MPSKERLPLTINLTPGRDDDLIQWVREVDANPEMSRVRAGKMILRAGLGLEQPPQPAQQATSLQIEEHVKSLSQTVSQLMLKSQQQPTVPDDLTEKIKWIEEALHWLNEQVLALNGTAPPKAPEVENQPRATEEQMTKRKSRLKKAKW